MSFARLVYYSALVGGWAAFLGWAVVELLFDGPGLLAATVTGGLIGAAISAGLEVVGGLAAGSVRQMVLRGASALGLGGLLGGLAALLGEALVSAAGEALRVLGWLVLGMAVGIVGGVCGLSRRKGINGLIGGGIGGLIGGLIYIPVGVLRQSLQIGTNTTAQVIGFVALGLAIGFSIGLAQVVLKDAWLTVEDGWRAGRQLVLTQPVTALGRGDHLPLPFLGPMNKDIEAEHCRVLRQPNGAYVLEDAGGKLGTRLNSQPVQARVPLADGDVIKFGTNFVRFHERARRRDQAPIAPKPSPATAATSAPPPPRLKTPPVPKPPVVAPRPAAPAPAARPAATKPAPAPSPPPAQPTGIRPPPPPPKRK